MNYLHMTGGLPWLSILVFVPLVGAALAAIGPAGRQGRFVKWGSLLFSLVPLAIVLYLWTMYEGAVVDAGRQQIFQWGEQLPWISVLGIHYKLGLDGLSLPLVILTVVLTPISILAAFDVDRHPRYFFALIFLMETAMLGVFLSLDFFLFFIFWEVSLIPGYFLIAVWGRTRRRYAAFKFFVYTMAASVGLLLAFELLYLATAAAGRGTFDLIELARLAQGLPVEVTTGTNFSGDLQSLVFKYLQQVGVTGVGGSSFTWMALVFLIVFVAFAVKLGIWPFHTWLPDAYAEAPTAGSMLIGGVLTKMGAFAMLRLLLPIFPAQMQVFAPLLGTLACISVLIGAWVAFSYRDGDIKRLISYLSINHMGYVMLAIAAAGAIPRSIGADPGNLDARATAINGAMMQMFAHGFSTAALFVFAGILASRTGTYILKDYGGLLAVAPALGGLMGIAMFANLGLPGMAGFVGEFFIFSGAWSTLPVLTGLAMFGLVISALTLLLMFQRIFFGPLNERWRSFPELGWREWCVVLPMLLVLVFFGVYPLPLMDVANQTSLAVVRFFAGSGL